MNLAKLSTNGQITVPAAIRRRLRLVPGDKVLFVENARGEIVIANAALASLTDAQHAFAGAAPDFAVDDESDVQALVDEVRADHRAS